MGLARARVSASLAETARPFSQESWIARSSSTVQAVGPTPDERPHQVWPGVGEGDAEIGAVVQADHDHPLRAELSAQLADQLDGVGDLAAGAEPLASSARS